MRYRAPILMVVAAGLLLLAGSADAQQASPRRLKADQAYKKWEERKFDEAERLVEEGLALDPNNNDWIQGYLLDTKGLIREAQTTRPRFLEEAADLFRQSAAIYRAIAARDPSRNLALGTVQMHLGNALKKDGRYPQAEQAFEEGRQALNAAIDAQEKAPKPDYSQITPMLSRIQRNRGELALLMGRYDDGIKLLKVSLENAQSQWSRRHVDLVPQAHNILGALFEAKGHLEEAERHFRQCLAAWEAAGLGQSHLAASASSNLAWVCDRQGKAAEAERLFRQCLPVLRQKVGEESSEVARAEANLGWLLLRNGDRTGEAGALLEHSLRVRQQLLGNDHPDVSLSHFNLGLREAAQGRWTPAAEQVHQGRKSLSRFLDGNLPFAAEFEQLAILGRQQESIRTALSMGLERKNDNNLVEKSAEWALNSKGLSLRAMAEQALQARDSQDPRMRELTRIRSSLAQLTLNSGDPNPERKKRAEADRKRLQQEEIDLGKALARSGSGRQRSSWLTLDKVQHHLPADAVLIQMAKVDRWDFTPGAKQRPGERVHYIAWVIPAAGKGPVRIVDLGLASRVDAAIATLRDELDQSEKTIPALREKGAAKKLERPLAAVAALVLQPLEASAGAVERWLLSPDGNLWLIPWAALPSSKGNLALHHYKMSYLVSGTEFAQPHSSRPAGPALVMGNPAYSANQLDDGSGGTRGGQVVPIEKFHTVTFTPLADTESEAKVAAQQLANLTGQSANLYLRVQATEGAFKRAFPTSPKSPPGPRFVVLSTHGYALAESPASEQVNPLLMCGLAFAGANHRKEARGEDGVLTGLEIVGCDLRDTELVVMSACQTALGAVRHGEGVVGLRHAFHLAGARSVMGTLWEIPSKESAELMENFFKNLAAGMGKADALRKAQLKMVSDREGSFGAAHPFFWAGYTLTGLPD